MTVCDARVLTEQAFDFSKSDDRGHRTPDKHAMVGRPFVRSVSLAFRCEPCADMRESGEEGMSVDQMLAI